MSNETPSTRSAPVSRAVHSTELARQRAAAADAWRAYVESGALIHRQRAQFLENRADQLARSLAEQRIQASRLTNRIDDLESWLHLAGEREDRARLEIQRLEQRTAELLDNPSIWYACKRQFKNSRLGALLRRLKPRAAPDSHTETVPAVSGDAVAAGTIPDQGPLAPTCTEHTGGHGHPSPPSMVQREGAWVQTKRTVLLVAAHADDDPLGRYALDLVSGFEPHCNVLVWQMGTGALMPAFEAGSAGFLADPASQHDYALARQTAFGILDQFTGIDFAVVAGREAKSVLPALFDRGLASVMLLHEPASYAISVYAYQEIFFWATHTCFTTHAALAQARRICTYLQPAAASALVPAAGPHSLPRLQGDAQADGMLRHRLADADQPAPDAVIAGWGPVDYNGGVDMFITCADALLRSAPGKRYRFIWLAQPQAEPQDASYPMAIQAQIERLGLGGQISILYEPASRSIAPDVPAVVLLPARGDVLQQQALQALHLGIPVLAFDGATILAGALREHGLADACLARWGDVPQLAAKALALLGNAQSHAAVSARLKSLDWQALSMGAYIQALLIKGDASREQLKQECIDAALITASGQLRPDYMGEIVHYNGQLSCEPARLYVRGWKAGVGMRKPRPGILPSIYAVERMDPVSSEDPFARYLRDGRPTGAWDYPVILPTATPAMAPATDTVRIALHIHAYYPDMLGEILRCLHRNRTRPDLFISVKDAEAQVMASQALAHYDGAVCAIEVVPNRGRDIGPFLTTFGARLVRDYDLIGHIHTKRSTHADRVVIDMWRNFLMQNLLGGDNSGPMLDTIVESMVAHPLWGIVFPDDPVPLGWDSNRPCAQALADKMMSGPLPEHFNFPAGTMFWIRAGALEPFVALDLQYDDYPIEPLPIDGTLLHAIERLFGVVPRALGMECALTTVPGVSR